ncbi:MAG: hypothetical protein WDZ29_03310 [Balneolaceae bacterium]
MERTKSKRSLKNPALKSKGHADGSPRYKPGKNLVYDQAYQQAVDSSPIFNEKVRSNSIRDSGILHNLKSTLLELEGIESGDNQGKYRAPYNEWKTALIPLAKQEVAELHQRFKEWSTQQVKEGKALKPQKNWPPQLLELRLKREALLDVRRKEAHYIKNLIEQKKAEKEKSRKAKILELGPMGKFTKRPEKDGRLTEIDGQKISYAGAVPFIDEPISPYYKMTVFDYRKMAEKWKEEKGLTMEQLRKKRDEIFKQKKMEALLNDEQPPTNLSADLVVTASKLSHWIKRLGITKNDWPSWPKNAKPIDEHSLENS